MEYAELELSLRRRDVDSYTLELRYSRPGDAADIRLLRNQTAAVQFNLPLLLEQSDDLTAYGRTLSNALYDDPEVRIRLIQALTNAESVNAPLRLRLFIDTSAQELHSIRWELLRHPKHDTSLCSGDRVYFSRYLSSDDWRPIEMRSRGDLRVLVVVANPVGLEEFRLSPIDAPGELRRVRSALPGLEMSSLAEPGQATIGNIVAQLQRGYDILYLVCHGTLDKGETWLWLEDSERKIARISGASLVTNFNQMSHRPTLMVLSACQTGGAQQDLSDRGQALITLGPLLAEAGIPAVVAMHGNISVTTANSFLSRFFKEIRENGQVDRAGAIARAAVQDRDDAWMPVLYMRLKSGRIWYSPAFAPDERGSGRDKWPAIRESLRNGECTPIIGPDMTEGLFGRRADIAWRLANDYHFPLNPHDREGLPRVAQWLTIDQGRKFVYSQLIRMLYKGIQARHDTPPKGFEQIDPNEKPIHELLVLLDELITTAWHQRKEHIAAEPHLVLAEQPISVFITTDASNLLETALRAAGKKPISLVCPWKQSIIASPELWTLDQEINHQQPLVYHLFGNLRSSDTLVLTEDDFFDFLIGVTRNSDLIAGVVRASLVGSALMLLGFQMDDWHFRTFFRFVMNLGGRAGMEDFSHLAVQVSPGEDRIIDPRRARQFLETYFIRNDKVPISIYWGNAEDFTKELRATRQVGGA